MNIQKKLALMGALALPLAGLATFGGAQVAGAATPLLTCQAVSPAAGATGGESFTLNSDGSNPGSAGINFDASAGGTMELGAGASENATSLSLIDPVGSTALATTTQVLTIAGADGTYTVTSDTFGALPPHTPDVVTITPALSITGGGAKPLKAKAAVTVSPTATTAYRTVSDGAITGTSFTSATAHFVSGDVGSPVQGEFGATHGSGGTAVVSGITGSPLTIATVNSSTSATLSSPAEQETSAGPPATYAPISGTGGTFTIGQTTVAPANLYPVQNLAASNCGSSAIAVGEFAPLTANLHGVGTGTVQNTALASGVRSAGHDVQHHLPDDR